VYLKSIDIQGFKSFPEKIKINFGEGITAIVGPNGSGKSNVCDAIRWVLGEQSSKTLRGAKMEDVVFNGTQKRKAVGFAEVSLTIDNQAQILQSPYSEITVKRRYYRSGESEYFINQTPSRLKDIHELFMDTGLGRDGYSIIGQGRIAEILSLKSEDRRQIFEEASGITKYRVRKAEAQRKLEQTEVNLDRINDIAQELQDRMEPLGVQAQKAKKYLELFERLKELEINTWLREIDAQKSAIEKYNDDFAIAQMTLEQNQTDMEASDTEIERLYEDMRQKDTQCELIRQEIKDVEVRVGETTSRISILKNNIHNNQNNIENIQAQLREEKTKSESLQDKTDECLKEILQISQQEQELAKSLTELLTNSEGLFARGQTTDEELRSKGRDLSQAMERLSDDKISLSGRQAQLSALLERRADLDLEIGQAGEEKKNKEQLLTQLKETLQNQKDEIVSAQNVLSGYTKKMQLVQKRYEDGQAQLGALEKSRHEKETRLTLLSDLEREFNGFSRSVKEIMLQKERGRLKGIDGPVSQIIKVKDEEAVAIEVALGGSLQSIIVDSDEDGKAAISFLKANNYGRATFLPVGSIRGNVLKEGDIKDKKGLVGIASNLVACDNRYKNILESLLGRILIAKDLDCAVSMAKKNGYRFRIVTLDGQVVNAGGSMTGGSLNKNTGVLSRANEIKRLKLEVEKITDQLKSHKDQQNKVEEERTLLIARIQDCESEILEGKRKTDLLYERQTAQQEGLLGVCTRISILSQEQADSEIKKEELKKNITSGSLQIEKNQELIEALTQELDKIRGNQKEIFNEQERISAQIMDKKLAIQAKQKDRQAIQLQVEQLKIQMEELSAQDDRRNTDIDEIQAQNKEYEKEIEGQETALAQMKAAIESKEKLIMAQIDAKLHIEGRIAKLQKETTQKRNRLLEMQKEYARLESRLSAARLSYENILNKMWESYELSYTAALKYRLEEFVSAAEANRSISSIKNEIKGLGNVNLDAIEEYKEVSERFAFISEQKADLEKAKEGLLHIIKNMLGKMREIFSQQFQIINTEFGKTFYELFGGGKAILELTDPTDPLGSGIEIKVQPPGKNVRSLSLLSGGEQAFVAIALIFAILRVRPTPFCVFDEIEAALDDVNINRFVTYLNRYKNKIQFILITHRRPTMEAADILYGVTMQEHGVSKLLAINVAEMERHIKA
jgi:chromosome segregation protein